MKLARYLGTLGYGSRREIEALFAAGRVCDETGQPLSGEQPVAHQRVRIDGAELDPPPGLVLMLHKPRGYTCSLDDRGPLVYALLPGRFRLRRPVVSTVGRLDRDTSGLLLLTDDGALLHRIISPRRHVAKVYEARLARPLRGDEAEIFASGELRLRGERRPLLPARLEPIDERHVRLILHEGRYHQVRRMFAAVGNHVEALHRSAIGSLGLGGLAAGQWRLLEPDDVARIFDPA